jgi:hypothetical protein
MDHTLYYFDILGAGFHLRRFLPQVEKAYRFRQTSQTRRFWIFPQLGLHFWLPAESSSRRTN